MGLAAAAAIVLLCAVRGCIISRQPNEKPEGMLSISLYDRASGKTEEMPLEEYLIGVVGAEMPASFKNVGPSSRQVGMESSRVPSISKIALCNRMNDLNLRKF